VLWHHTCSSFGCTQAAFKTFSIFFFSFPKWQALLY
jgi:hypothetical protein